MNKAAQKKGGIIRNKMTNLLEAKQSLRKKLSRFAKTNLESSGISVASTASPVTRTTSIMERSLLDKDAATIQMTTMSTLPPEWVDKFQQCQSIAREISELKKELVILNARRLNTIRQKESAEIDRAVYDKASQATAKIRQCNNMLKQIQKAPKTSHIDKELCTKMCTALSIEIQERTREMRQQQREYLQHRKRLDSSIKVSFLEMSAERTLNRDEPEQLDFEYDDAKLQEMEMQERNEEILKMVQSVQELNDIYRELSGLVIIQGTLLDQIDMNITDAAKHTAEAKTHLQKAREHQKSPLASRCMIALLAIIAILSIVMIVKYSRK